VIVDLSTTFILLCIFVRHSRCLTNCSTIWKLEGSKDGEHWEELLHTQPALTGRSMMITTKVNSKVPFQYFKLVSSAGRCLHIGHIILIIYFIPKVNFEEVKRLNSMARQM
jgi:hypothetical protein